MFGKFFKSTFTGSMMGAGANVFAVWGYVIAHADSGTVEINPRLVAAVIGMPEADVSSAIKQLCAPDPRSRSKIADGRRLIREGEFTFSVPTHGIYRAIRSEEDRRAYNREKQREHRARLKSVNTSVIDSQSQSSLSAYTEAEEEQEAEKERDTDLRTRDPDPAGARAGVGAQARDHARSNGHAKIWKAYDWKVAYGLAWRDKYEQNAYGMSGDAKACSTLDITLGSIPDADRLAAQAIAPEMFAEFLASKDPVTVQKRHPFAFFVGEWGGLRVPKRRAREPGGMLQAPKLPDASELE